MNNWPFHRQPPWWRVPVGLFGLTATVLLIPVVLILLALFGLLVWGFWATGSHFVAIFMVAAIALVILTMGASSRS